WYECVDVTLHSTSRRVAVQIPMGYTEMLAEAPDLAMTWRLQTREIFTEYFGRGYKAVDFSLDRAARTGAYLLVSQRGERIDADGPPRRQDAGAERQD